MASARNLWMCLEQALTIAGTSAVGCCLGKLGGLPSKTHVWLISCTLAEIDPEVTCACEFDLGFYFRSECKKWWMFLEDKKPLHRSVKEIQLEHRE